MLGHHCLLALYFGFGSLELMPLLKAEQLSAFAIGFLNVVSNVWAIDQTSVNAMNIPHNRLLIF
jgi:hypothetical protein